MPARLLPLILLAACASPPAGPGLLTPAQIAGATQGSPAPPRNDALLARADRLNARAAILRRTRADDGPRARAARLTAS